MASALRTNHLLAIVSTTNHFIGQNCYTIIRGFKLISDYESKVIIQLLSRNICLGYI